MSSCPICNEQGKIKIIKYTSTQLRWLDLAQININPVSIQVCQNDYCKNIWMDDEELARIEAIILRDKLIDKKPKKKIKKRGRPKSK
jgi:hypothetical protein